MLSKTSLFANLTVFFLPCVALGMEVSPVQGALAFQGAQVREIIKRSQGPFINDDYKREAQALEKQVLILNHLIAKDPTALSVKPTMQVAAARISRQMSHRDICQNGFVALTNQQCISVELSNARTNFIAASAGSHILFLGGENKAGPSATVNVFDAETNEWSSTNLKTLKGRVGAQTAGDSRAVVYSLNRSSSPTIDVEVYNSLTKSWSTSSSPTSLTSVRSAAAEGKVMFWNYGTPQPNLDVFDAVGNVWSQIPTPTKSSWSVSLSGSDRAIFVRGTASAFAKSTALDIYDPAQNSWSLVNIPVDFQASFTAGTYFNSKAYLIAREKGSDFDQTLDRPLCRQKLMVYDFPTQAWTQKFIPGCSQNWSVAGSGSKIVFAADFDSDAGSSRDPHKAFVFDVSGNRWDTVHLSLAGTSKPMAAARNKILIGTGQSSFSDANIVADVNIFEVLQNAWTAKSPLFVARDDSPMAIGRLNYVKSAGGKLGGWAADARNLRTPLKVKFFLDGNNSSGKFIGETLANTNGFDNDNDGLHGFVYRIPASFIDNKVHDLYAYAVDTDGTERILLGSPVKFMALKPSYSPESMRAFLSAFSQRPAFPSSCNGSCHNFTYEDRWTAATSEFEVGHWSTENNRLIKKMRSGQHGGPPFDEISIGLVKAWLDIEFR